MIADDGETIVVEGEAPATPAPSERVVDAATIAVTPRRSAEDLLRLAPGLHTSQHAAEGKAPQIFLRGFDAVHGANLELRLAGVPLNEPSNVHGQGYLDLGPIVPEAIASLAVREGAFALDQGPFATAGTADLRVGVPAPLRGQRAGVEAGTTGRLRVLALAAPVARADEEVVAVEAVGDRGYGEGRGVARAALLAQTRIDRGALRILPLLSWFGARFGEPGIVPLADVERGAIAADGSYTPDLASTSTRLLGGATLDWARGADRAVATAWLSGRHLALDENFTGYLLDAERGDRRRQVHAAASAGVAARAERDLGAVTLRGLATLSTDRFTQREDRLDEAEMPWAAAHDLAGAHTAGALGAGIAARRGRFDLEVGLRADALALAADDRLDDTRDGAATIATVSPRLRGAWRAGRATVGVGAGRGVRPPEARAADDRPRWVAADGAELTVAWESTRVSLGAAAFAATIAREPVLDHVAGRVLERDRSRRVGAELTVVARPAPAVELRADLAAVDARFTGTRDPIPGVPRLIASVEARAWRGPWSGGAIARVLGPRPLGHGAVGQGQHVVDAIGAWRRGHVEVALSLDNLTGSDWRDGEYHVASWWDRTAPRSEIPRVHLAAGRPFGARLALTLHH